MTERFEELVDENGRASFTNQAIARWLGMRIEIIGLLWIAGAFLFSYLRASGNSNNG